MRSIFFKPNSRTTLTKPLCLHVYFRAATLTLVSLFLVVPSAEAESYRTHLQQWAESRLEKYAEAKDAIDRGRGVCWLGTLSSWDEFIVQLSDDGTRNGFEAGDHIVAIDNHDVVDGNTRAILAGYVPDDTLVVTVERSSEQINLSAVCYDGSLRTQAFINMLEAVVDGKWQQCMSFADLADEIGGSEIAFTANYRERCSEAMRCDAFRCNAPTRETAQLLVEYRDLAIRASEIAGRFEKQRPRVLSSIKWLRDNSFPELADRLETKIELLDAIDSGE